MKIEPGYYRTRGGLRAQVLAVNVRGLTNGYTVVGVLTGTAETWADNGTFRNSGQTSPNDLTEPWRDPITVERVVWIVRHSDGLLEAYASIGTRQPNVDGTIIGSTRVTVTEGVFA
jgi:hypothetical protein